MRLLLRLSHTRSRLDARAQVSHKSHPVPNRSQHPQHRHATVRRPLLVRAGAHQMVSCSSHFSPHASQNHRSEPAALKSRRSPIVYFFSGCSSAIVVEHGALRSWRTKLVEHRRTEVVEHGALRAHCGRSAVL